MNRSTPQVVRLRFSLVKIGILYSPLQKLRGDYPKVKYYLLKKYFRTAVFICAPYKTKDKIFLPQQNKNTKK